MFSYTIIHPPKFNFQGDIVDTIFKNISKNIDIPQRWIINIVFVPESEIQELNKNYRDKDKSTDVLSFHYFEDFSTLEENEVAWELIFCEEKILLQGKEYWLWSEKEFYKLLIHSLLHVLGHDHEEDEEYKEMQSLEDAIWEKTFSKE